MNVPIKALSTGAVCDGYVPDGDPVEVPVTLRVSPPELTPRRRAASARLFVRCSCGSWIDWRGARWVGVQQDDTERLELRNCPRCGSTRALVVAAKESA